MCAEILCGPLRWYEPRDDDVGGAVNINGTSNNDTAVLLNRLDGDNDRSADQSRINTSGPMNCTKICRFSNSTIQKLRAWNEHKSTQDASTSVQYKNRQWPLISSTQVAVSGWVSDWYNTWLTTRCILYLTWVRQQHI